MKNESALQFETESRIHMGLAVKNLNQSVAFLPDGAGDDVARHDTSNGVKHTEIPTA